MYFGFEHISAAYGTREILHDLSLEIPRGRTVALIGPNGCGKSTLLRTVVRTVRPTAGCVIFDDMPLSLYAPRELARRIAYLPQMHGEMPEMDVRTLVACGRYPYARFGRPLSRTDHECVDRALAETGMEGLADRPFYTLSGGEQQRARIAMCAAQTPEILVLDEPTTYLDISYQLDVLALIRRLSETRNITVLMVLHDLNHAARFSDFLCAIRDGAVRAFGTPEQVMTAENLRRIFGIEARILQDAESKCPYFIPAGKGDFS